MCTLRTYACAYALHSRACVHLIPPMAEDLSIFAQLIIKECSQPDERIILRYLEAGHGVDDLDIAPPYGTLLHMALADPTTRVAKMLLEAGANN
jgi:hypothetical protein